MQSRTQLEKEPANHYYNYSNLVYRYAITMEKLISILLDDVSHK